MKPSVRKNPGHSILHIGTDDLISDKSPERIAKSVADVENSLKNKSRDISISNITLRNDKFKEKDVEVNDYLARLCIERNIYFISHAKNILTHHLHKSRLYLNRNVVVFCLVILPKLFLIFLNQLLKHMKKIIF